MLKRFHIVLLALVAVVAATAPPATATRPVSDSLPLDLEIFDLDTTIACDGQWVFAAVSGVLERHLHFADDGTIARQVETFKGRMTWFTRGTGKSYSAAVANTTTFEFPDGVDLFDPVRVTATGSHGGVFPIGVGPAGTGRLVYDGFVIAQEDAGFVYTMTEGAPISISGNFENATQRICDAIA
jgi:hypothetical protein